MNKPSSYLQEQAALASIAIAFGGSASGLLNADAVELIDYEVVRNITVEDSINIFRAEAIARTTTVKGLTVYVDINSKTYDIQRPINDSYEKKVTQRIVFHEHLPKWNYLIKPA